MKEGVILMYCKEGTLYPVSLTEEENNLLQLTIASLFRPLKVVTDQPQGNVINLGKRKTH